MKRILMLLLIAAFTLTSCDIFINREEEKGKLYLVALGLGYRENPEINSLNNTINDYRGMIEQFEVLAQLSDTPYEITTYSDFASKDGKITLGFDHWSSNDSSKLEYDEKERTVREPETVLQETKDSESIEDMFFRSLYESFTTDSKPEKDDTIIFYFTGHGTEKKGPVVHHSRNADTPSWTAITYEDIEKKFLSRFPSTSIAIIDCCYSGSSTLDSELGLSLGFNDKKDKYGNSEEKLRQNAISDSLKNAYDCSTSEINATPRHYYLAASSPKQKSYEYDIFNNDKNSESYGAFTYQVLRFLGYDTENMEPAYPMDKIGTTMRLSELYSYVKENMSDGNRKSATPHLTRSRYDITLFDFRK